jgi:hypothetical protein
MVHPKSESVVGHHARHRQQSIAAKSGKIRSLAKHHAVEVALRQPHFVEGPQPYAVTGESEIEGELGEAPNIIRPYLNSEFFVQLADQCVNRFLVWLDGSAEAAPMVRIKDVGIGIA